MKGDNRLNGIYEMMCLVVTLCGGDSSPWENRAQELKDIAKANRDMRYHGITPPPHTPLAMVASRVGTPASTVGKGVASSTAVNTETGKGKGSGSISTLATPATPATPPRPWRKRTWKEAQASTSSWQESWAGNDWEAEDWQEDCWVVEDEEKPAKAAHKKVKHDEYQWTGEDLRRTFDL